MNISDHSTSLQKISEQIEQMKSETALKEGISYHDVHQFTAIYIMMVGCVIAAAVYIGRCMHRRHRCRRSADLQSTQEQQTMHEGKDSCPQPHPRNPGQHRENIELRTFSNVSSAVKQNKATSPIFQKPLYSYNDSD